MDGGKKRRGEGDRRVAKRRVEAAISVAWRSLSWWPLAVVVGAIVVAILVIGSFREQTDLNTAADSAVLRSLLPGYLSLGDARHSVVFLAAVLLLLVQMVLIAANRLLANEPVSFRWAAGLLGCAALAVALVFFVLQIFLYRSATVTVGPGETVLVSSLDLTLKGQVTGWTPREGTFATLESAPRLASPTLAGPFGEQDRPVNARLAIDSTDIELVRGEVGRSGHWQLRVLESPAAWAARVRLSYGGVDEEAPFLQSGQSWSPRSIPSEQGFLVAIERILPSFQRDVSILYQPLGGVPSNPAVVVTLRGDKGVIDSQAIAPAEKRLFGDVGVQVSAFAPVVRVQISNRSWIVPAALAAGVSLLSGLAWAVLAVLHRRRRERGLARSGPPDPQE